MSAAEVRHGQAQYVRDQASLYYALGLEDNPLYRLLPCCFFCGSDELATDHVDAALRSALVASSAGPARFLRGGHARDRVPRRRSVTPRPDHTPRRPPLLDGALARNCTRWLGDHNCGKDAVRHVLWDETMENGFVCSEHLAEIGPVWTYFALHEVGADCAMPGSLFFEELNVCRCPDELVAAPEEIKYATA